MADLLCIQCGLKTGETHRLNRLPDGKVCPACSERVLASLPAALPAPVRSASGSPTRSRLQRVKRARRTRDDSA